MKTLYSVTCYDRDAPDCQFKIALWAADWGMAYRRGMRCGLVIDVRDMPGTWPLEVRKTARLLPLES